MERLDPTREELRRTLQRQIAAATALIDDAKAAIEQAQEFLALIDSVADS